MRSFYHERDVEEAVITLQVLDKMISESEGLENVRDKSLYSLFGNDRLKHTQGLVEAVTQWWEQHVPGDGIDLMLSDDADGYRTFVVSNLGVVGLWRDYDNGDDGTELYVSQFGVYRLATKSSYSEYQEIHISDLCKWMFESNFTDAEVIKMLVPLLFIAQNRSKITGSRTCYKHLFDRYSMDKVRRITTVLNADMDLCFSIFKNLFERFENPTDHIGVNLVTGKGVRYLATSQRGYIHIVRGATATKEEIAEMHKVPWQLKTSEHSSSSSLSTNSLLEVLHSLGDEILLGGNGNTVGELFKMEKNLKSIPAAVKAGLPRSYLALLVGEGYVAGNSLASFISSDLLMRLSVPGRRLALCGKKGLIRRTSADTATLVVDNEGRVNIVKPRSRFTYSGSLEVNLVFGKLAGLVSEDAQTYPDNTEEVYMTSAFSQLTRELQLNSVLTDEGPLHRVSTADRSDVIIESIAVLYAKLCKSVSGPCRCTGEERGVVDNELLCDLAVTQRHYAFVKDDDYRLIHSDKSVLFYGECSSEPLTVVAGRHSSEFAKAVSTA